MAMAAKITAARELARRLAEEKAAAAAAAGGGKAQDPERWDSIGGVGVAGRRCTSGPCRRAQTDGGMGHHMGQDGCGARVRSRRWPLGWRQGDIP